MAANARQGADAWGRTWDDTQAPLGSVGAGAGSRGRKALKGVGWQFGVGTRQSYAMAQGVMGSTG